MLNLTYYQSLFNENNTESRCRKILDEVSPVSKRLIERFVENIGLTIGDEYVIRSYDETLSTTYYDARNPTYAEQKRNSNIGRKYWVGIYRNVDGKEYNLLTLEFNGIARNIFIHTEHKFVLFWAWIKNNKMDQVLATIPSTYTLSAGKMEKEIIEKERFISFVKGCIKQRKRPPVQVGLSQSLEGQMDDNVVVDKLVEAWGQLVNFRKYVDTNIDLSRKAYEALMVLAEARYIKETHLLGRDYKVELSALEDYKDGKRQAFHIYDGEQLVTKGSLSYLEYHDKNSPFPTIMVPLEGHNHIFTSSKEIIGANTQEWWITKVFSTQSLNNQEVMSKAMQLLKEHQIQVKDNTYYVGSYHNETQSFVEEREIVKKNFINAALLFAHASQKIELPTNEEESSKGNESEPVFEGMEPNFHFQEIYQQIEDSQFTFSKEIIRDLHLNLTALDDKHFVLLSGISGTGKTQLCRLYANAVYGLDYESENPYFTIIPVRPDWTDASALFGYYSSFEKRYVKTEFLNVILNALKEREKPHFILLDEMNLARVEYYLSDYLSAVESRKEIPLHQDEAVTDVPKKLMIPPNVYILGTINVDETTHSISDKVLDRAFVMMLSDVDFDAYWERMDQELKTTIHKEFNMLIKLHGLLIDCELHFGYRTMGEMVQKLYANAQLPEEYQMDPMDALDRVISEKILTKIRGDERISEMLAKLEHWLKQNLEKTTISLTFIKRMQEELEFYGATQFWR
ncbi:McrB family protein [Alkalihalobacillus trypoxylicola]|uniref:ATPase dynein-related AAA domain-containing protein n=1 Tax=Alkalihalobacillus trypoxylicola TaxID=519424 RepID=A0A161QFR6_9BACI|nr:AAA family ATPase [Alkalihalobacillus trypoxylicola]KYG27729.1 hypothetical protein AZF04_11110 [Alkalihalobacillus trypoxylicola]